jgi:hypothetical protein
MIIMGIATMLSAIAYLSSCTKDDPPPDDKPFQNACCVTDQVDRDNDYLCTVVDSSQVEIEGKWVWQYKYSCANKDCVYYVRALAGDGSVVIYEAKGCACNNKRNPYEAIPKQ